MPSEESAQITKALVNIDAKVLTLVYKDLAKPGVQQVGKALSTVLGLGNTVLLPIKLLNDKAQLLYAKHMEQYREKLESIPEDKIVEVAPEIGVPIIENLGKTTNEKISELYINLLANASSIEFVGDTHPRFVTIVESLTPDEVKILEHAKASTIPFITITMRVDFKALKIDRPDEAHLLNGIDSEFGEVTLSQRATIFEKNDRLSLPERAKFYFQNLEGLGLIWADTESFVLGPVYEPLMNAFDDVISANTSHSKQSVTKGSYELTEFGKLFLKACHANTENK